MAFVFFSLIALAEMSPELDHAIAMGDKKMFEGLIAKMVDIDEPLNPQKENSLALAAYNDRTEFVETLLQRGAKVDHQTTTGYTALMFAAMAMNNSDEALKTVKVLLNAKANRHLKNMDGKTAADLAKDHKQPKIIAVLKGR